MKIIKTSPQPRRSFLKMLLLFPLWGLGGFFCYAQHTHADGSTHEDHGAEENKKTGSEKMQKSEAVSERYELVLKYEHLHAEEPVTMMLYVSDIATNRAIGGAKLTVSSSLAPSAKFNVQPVEKGVYRISTTFPRDRTYALTVKIDGESGSDLVLLRGINVGHEEAIEPIESSSPFNISSWQFWSLLGGGLLLGILLTYLVMRSRNRKALVVLIIVFSQLPTANWHTTQAQHTHADGSTHDDEGGTSTANLSDEFDIPKETQFLFEILTQPLNEGGFAETVQLYGTIVPSSTGQAVVQTPQTGRLVGLNARVGQRVNKGQTLATLEQALDATAQVSLQAERNTVEAELTAARKEYERLKKIEDIAAKRDISEAEARLQKAEENLKVFNGIAKGNKGSTRMVALTAPISGIISPFSVAIGSTVGSGETIFTITNLSTVYIEAQAFGGDAQRLQSSSKLDVISTADGTQKRSDRIRLLSSAQSVNANQSQKLLFELNNADGAFKIGEFVTVRLQTGQSTRTLSLPNAAISQVNGKPVVFVKEHPETFRVAYVATGTNNGDRTTITKGLETGDKVVINSAYQLKMMFMNQ